MLTRSATRRTDSTASSRNSEAGTPVPSRKGSRVNTPKAAPKLPKKADEKSRQVSKKTTNSDDPSVKEQNSARTSRPTTRTIPKTAAESKPTTAPRPKPAKTDSFDKEPVVIVKKKQPEVQKQQSTPARNVTTRRRKAEISQEDETMPPDDPWDSQQPESKSGGRSKKRAKEDDSQQTQDTQQQGNASQSQVTASQGVGTQNSSLSRKALLKNAKLGKMISTGVMNAFRGFIESKDEQGAQTSLKQLRIVYMKSLENPSMKASFSEEFDISFGNLVAGNFDMEARQQAIRLMIKFIYSMAVEDKGTLLLPAFIQYCVTLMTCEDSIVRQNIVFIVGCLFEENKKLNEEILSDEQRNALYRLLLNGHNDKVAVVRAEVVRAVASLQNDDIDSEFTEALEKAPNEILLDSQRDMCMETRAMVVKYRSVQNGDALQSLFKIAESDPILKVRQEAFARIASVDMKLLSEHRRDLTKLTLEALTESGSESRHACRVYFLNQMIDSCVKFLKSEAEKDQQNDSFLASSQPEPEYDEEHFYAVSPYVFLKLFVDMQDLVESVPIVRCLLNLVDNRIKRGQFTSTREQFAEIISRDVFPVIITKKTYTQLISTTYEDQLRFAFFWRVMLEVFIEKCDSMSAERWAILARIAPTLEETCVLVRK
ncbi:hypothetical protein WR25_27004 isoform A [Diploscapter pachys]|uniref:Nuclear condensin complex subunit 3 C-terminal domain-containing protein n=2 Tax=Diploscapter pachys TaxID=2018661 RepID=A0A2A2L7G1_9BILA|nr:hypothetical protein WR25_27004 isoform A [Diploscapter pachys]